MSRGTREGPISSLPPDIVGLVAQSLGRLDPSNYRDMLSRSSAQGINLAPTQQQLLSRSHQNLALARGIRDGPLTGDLVELLAQYLHSLDPRNYRNVLNRHLEQGITLNPTMQ